MARNTTENFDSTRTTTTRASPRWYSCLDSKRASKSELDAPRLYYFIRLTTDVTWVRPRAIGRELSPLWLPRPTLYTCTIFTVTLLVCCYNDVRGYTTRYRFGCIGQKFLASRLARETKRWSAKRTKKKLFDKEVVWSCWNCWNYDLNFSFWILKNILFLRHRKSFVFFLNDLKINWKMISFQKNIW